jgi:hypothetical protein
MHAAIVLALGLGPVAADEINATAASGKRTAIGTIGTYNTFTCESMGVPQSKIGRQPANGHLEIREETHVVDAGRCGRVNARVVAIYYTSRAGFRGTDEGGIDYVFLAFAEGATTTSARATFRITVR